VQRTRTDIKRDWEGEPCFPDREPMDKIYRLSPNYKALFAKTYAFCTDIVQSGEGLGKRQQRVRYWAALALLRCVMSSPAAAVAALENRRTALALAQDDANYKPFIYESGEDQTDDEQPTPPIDDADTMLGDSDRRRLRDLGRLARALHQSAHDTKLVECAALATDLLRQGSNPILWCRYIATADYLAEGLRRALQREWPKLQVLSITGQIGDDERSAKINEISSDTPRVLVATDCLSEGLNLHEKFDAVVHYDLPWNPNRLEQREGRVDRFGKTGIVKAIRYFSPDSAVDGVVLDVLLNKAREIHKALGTHVPVPDECETVTEAVLQALFLRRGRKETDQLQLDLEPEMPQVRDLHRRWDRDAERERVNRSRFAQRALKPAEVRDELEATDAVLGDPAAVRSFVLEAAQRLNVAIARAKSKDVYRVRVSPDATEGLPDAVRFALPAVKTGQWLISFTSPTPEGAEYLGRNHPFVATVARFLMEEALTKSGGARATRCGVIRTRVGKPPPKLCFLLVALIPAEPPLAALALRRGT
jgi:Helicase conserved C-terminal domain